jgi:hypothetical protein
MLPKRSNQKGAPTWTDADYVAAWKARCIVSEDGCWLWQGFKYRNGYAMAAYRGVNGRVHRHVYQIHKGPIPEDWDCCHTCDNRHCINPLHLFAASRATNVRDMLAKGRGNNQKKTSCIHGHEFSPENTYVDPRGYRHCKTCQKKWHSSVTHAEWRREYQRKRRAAQKATLSV